MRKNVEKIVNAFVNGRTYAEKNISTDGEVIRSYDMVIAQRLADGRMEVIDRDAGPTQTTKGHISAVAFGLESAGYTPKEVKTLSGRKPHVFRDRAGEEGYLDRHRPLRARPAFTDVRAEVAREAIAGRRLKIVK